MVSEHEHYCSPIGQHLITYNKRIYAVPLKDIYETNKQLNINYASKFTKYILIMNFN